MTLRIIDGGLSTQLEAQGVNLKEHPKLWTAGLLSSTDGRAELLKAHSAFIEAGADIVLTSSYQTSPDLAQDLLSASVHLALEARDTARALGRPIDVFLSLGPWGATQADGSEYTGVYPPSATKAFLSKFHASRLSLLLKDEKENSIDGLAFETIPSQLELSSILPLLSSPPYISIPAWITFSSNDGVLCCDGSLLSTAIEMCLSSFAAGPTEAPRWLGLNCVHPESVDAFLDSILPILETSTVAGVVLYPNNGGTWNAETRCWCELEGTSDVTDGTCSDGYTQKAKEWRDRIINGEKGGKDLMIGGCCSTDARTIKKLRECLLGN